MRQLILMLTACAALESVSLSPVQAMPAPSDPGASPASVILVAGGCGLGFHRGPYGGCRVNVVRGPVVDYRVYRRPVVVVRRRVFVYRR
jgi:hypothetical protein